MVDVERWLAWAYPRLKGMLEPRRLRHTQGVLELALRLAAVHGAHALRMSQAALLHDCAKNLPAGKLKSLLNKAGADPWERAHPALWHAVVGSHVARERFGVANAEVLKAIRCHSTGLPGASVLQQCLVVADRLEPGRKGRGLAAARKRAMRDLGAAYRDVLAEKICWLVEHGKTVHPRALKAWNSLLALRKK